ncbi:hypothetical protein LTR84_010147 [Exophiala bonariae]|uniref:Steroid 5-alpha reductase C-terminal domain-containing protein n=1 Tax=Exophiala bonariae TaxID=1690606 RepID=A0AAV9MUB3_9EURO|nr:hypothetical protein LTR84_010147 [Exophiala bonariae]
MTHLERNQFGFHILDLIRSSRETSDDPASVSPFLISAAQDQEHVLSGAGLHDTLLGFMDEEAQNPLYPSAAIAIGVFNTVFNTVNSLVFTLASHNPSCSHYDIHFGTAWYLVGIITETVGEIQRKGFKEKPDNKGKICKSGLYSVVRNVSYFGYTLWRTGYALGAGGASFFIYDFATRAIPVMDSYMTQKHGKQWAQTKQEVPYALIPGIW